MARQQNAAVLLVDQSRSTGRRVVAYLRERDYEVEWVDAAEKAYNRLDERLFDVLVTELFIGHADGMRLMAVAKERHSDICVVFTTKEPDIERATEAMRQGAYDFQTKPLNLAKLEAVIQRGLAHQQLVLDQVELKRRLDERFGLGSLIGKSRQMIQVYGAVREAAPKRMPVLLQGEPGTGKDLIAQAIHNSGARRDEAFVNLNCAGLPDAVVRDELFGGGENAVKSRLELADKGTLYLDNVGELSLSSQGLLLDFLETGVLPRGAGKKRAAADARVVTASNRPLKTLVNEGVFLPALHERLAAIVIEAPALRARREDIALLAQQVLDEAAEHYAKGGAVLTRNAVNLLIAYDWPGNVRELRNVIEGMVATARVGSALGVLDLPEYLRRRTAPDAAEIRIPAGTPMRQVERLAIEAAMRLCGYNKEKCAKTLGIGLRTLYRKLKEFEVR